MFLALLIISVKKNVFYILTVNVASFSGVQYYCEFPAHVFIYQSDIGSVSGSICHHEAWRYIPLMCDHYTNEVNGSAVLTLRWMPPQWMPHFWYAGVVCALQFSEISPFCFFFQILFIKMIAKVTPNNSIIFFPSVFLMSVFPAAQTLGWLWGKSWAISLWCCLCKWTASSSSTLIRWKKPTGLCKQLSPCRETLLSYGGCLSVPPR